jgi:hypothetical protein
MPRKQWILIGAKAVVQLRVYQSLLKVVTPFNSFYLVGFATAILSGVAECLLGISRRIGGLIDIFSRPDSRSTEIAKVGIVSTWQVLMKDFALLSSPITKDTLDATNNQFSKSSSNDFFI